MIVEYKDIKYTIVDSVKWRHCKALMKFGIEKVKDIAHNPEVADYMIKNFVTDPMLTDEILDNSDVDVVLFLIMAVNKVKFPEEFLSELKKKLS